MGLFDRFKRRPAAPADLREALLQAVHERDLKTLAVLCEDHQDEIRKSFPLWRKVPEAIAEDPAALSRYGEGLVAVARLFGQVGDQSLMTLLMGNEADNVLLVWHKDMGAAQSLIDEGRASEAVELLQSLITRIEKLKGSGVDQYLAPTCGMLGVALFRSGDKDRSVELTRKAKELCERSGDQEGIDVYTRNLEQMTEGATTVLRDSEGRIVSWEKLRDAAGPLRYEVLGSGKVSPEAQRLHDEGRQAGSAGDFLNALAKLERAWELAPDWPYPVYDMAYTYVLLKDFDRARACYRKTLELAPRGFFTAITALDTLLREEKSELPEGTYLAYQSLEWMDRERRADAARALAESLPNFAPAWKELALLSSGAERDAAIERGLSANPDAETKGILEINRAMALEAVGDHEDAIRLLEQLAADPASTFATEHLSKSILTNLVRK